MRTIRRCAPPSSTVWTGSALAVDAELNDAPSRVARVISPDGPPTRVAVIPTNEELAIAREAAALLSARTDD